MPGVVLIGQRKVAGSAIARVLLADFQCDLHQPGKAAAGPQIAQLVIDHKNALRIARLVLRHDGA